MSTAPKSSKEKAGKKGLQDFRALHDKNFLVPQRIKAGLDALGDGWEYEVDFVRSCGLSTTDFARFREQFEEFSVNVGSARSPKRVWAGTKAMAAKMRDML